VAGIEEVARAVGVSSATVSRALSGRGHVSAATRERVLEAAQQLGYVVSSSASALATGRMRNVGVVIPFLNRWFYGAVVEGAESALLAQGYDLTLYNLGGGAEERRSVFEHFLLRKRVDAVIAVSLELTPGEVERLHDVGKPMVGVGGPLPGVRTLSIDDLAVSRLATEHLIGLGHRRIAHIGGDRAVEMDFHLPTTRRLGYQAALADAGLPDDPALFQAGDFTMQGGYAAAKQLLGAPHNRPTAIFAASDEMAIGAILAARDLGLDVPRDVSIVGIDDHDLAPFFQLTTVAQYPMLQGRMAVDVLMQELHPGHPEPDSLNTPLPFDLVVRSSTARPDPNRS
jgi:LacI family transcriptional regulator, repressor for deo operon, udp, cdd, tsx, nupC, and nupG